MRIERAERVGREPGGLPALVARPKKAGPGGRPGGGRPPAPPDRRREAAEAFEVWRVAEVEARVLVGLGAAAAPADVESALDRAGAAEGAAVEAIRAAGGCDPALPCLYRDGPSGLFFLVMPDGYPYIDVGDLTVGQIFPLPAAQVVER